MKGAGRQKPLIAVLLPLLCYSHTCRTISVVVELIYAGVILNSLPFRNVVGKAEGLVWAPVVTRRGDYNSAGCLLVGIGSEMASSGLGLEEQQICPWVFTDLALSGQQEYFSTHTRTLAHNKDNDCH
jgi:hypothetical protein